jgi:4-amino-4-deoxy-L-arabinose transferase-like glycosyltransferase
VREIRSEIARFSGLFLMIAAIRFSLVLIFWPDYLSTATYPDEHNYYLAAARLINESVSGFFYSDRLLWNGPLNPLWVAVLGSRIALIKSLNIAIFSAASAFLTLAIASRYGRKAALMVGLGLLLYPPSYDLVPTLLTEPLFTAFLMCSLAVFIRGDFSVKAAAGSGFIIGFATLVRPTTQFFPFLIIALALMIIRRPIAKRVILHGVCAVVIMSPALFWNWYNFSKLGIANGSGALCLGSDLRVDGDEPIYHGVDFDTYETTAPFTHLDSEGDRRLMELTKSRVGKFPLQMIGLTLRKFGRFIFGSYYGYFWPYNGLVGKLTSGLPLSSKFSGIIWPLVHSFAVVIALGSIFIKQIPLCFRLYIGLMIFYFALIHAVAFPIPRMVFPLFPYILTLAAVGWVNMGRPTRLFSGALALSVFALVCSPKARVYPTEESREYIDVFSVRRVGGLSGAHDIESRQGQSIVLGSDPFLVFNFEQFELKRNQVISFQLRSNCVDPVVRSGTGQIFWANPNAGFSEDKSISFPLRSKDGYHVVRPALSTNWQGKLGSVRVDLPASFVGCSVDVDQVAVMN